MREGEKFIVISGLSGSGKSTAIKIFEDLGFYCVDNLPIALLPKFVELCRMSEGGLSRVAMGVDIRERGFLAEFPRLFQRLRRKVSIELIFFESSEKVLARRFSETRRPHPLAKEGPLAEGIKREMSAMKPIRRLADRIVDTSDMTVHDLKRMMTGLYLASDERRGLTVSLVSFGYKYGLPVGADIVMDVRFLPNPHFIEGLRRWSGKNRKVRDYIFSFPGTEAFLSKVEDLLAFLLPLYAAEGKSYLLIGLGCTGGRHRSVALAEELRKRLAERGCRMEVTHRDLEKEGP